MNFYVAVPKHCGENNQDDLSVHDCVPCGLSFASYDLWKHHTFNNCKLNVKIPTDFNKDKCRRIILLSGTKKSEKSIPAYRNTPENTNDQILTCEPCKIMFMSYTKYESHMIAEHGWQSPCTPLTQFEMHIEDVGNNCNTDYFDTADGITTMNSIPSLTPKMCMSVENLSSTISSNRTFKSDDNVKREIEEKSCRSVDDTIVLECDICKKVFADWTDMESHTCNSEESDSIIG